MLTLTLLAALVAAEPAAAPIPFDAITLERAAELDGHSVVITFTSDRPAYTWGEGKAVRTWCGPADVERTVSLKGDRLKDADEGKKLRVSGGLRVIRHPAEAGVEVPASKSGVGSNRTFDELTEHARSCDVRPPSA